MENYKQIYTISFTIFILWWKEIETLTQKALTILVSIILDPEKIHLNMIPKCICKLLLPEARFLNAVHYHPFFYPYQTLLFKDKTAKGYSGKSLILLYFLLYLPISHLPQTNP